jgi:hypothetical protein
MARKSSRAAFVFGASILSPIFLFVAVADGLAKIFALAIGGLYKLKDAITK